MKRLRVENEENPMKIIQPQKRYFNSGDGDNPHPWYGPCDGFGPFETCAECNSIKSPAAVKLAVAYRDFYFVLFRNVGIVGFLAGSVFGFLIGHTFQ